MNISISLLCLRGLKRGLESPKIEVQLTDNVLNEEMQEKQQIITS